MNDSTPQSHWIALEEAFRTLSGWRRRDVELLMEVEALLYLYESMTPDDDARSAKDAWALVSGYCIAGLNDSDDQRVRCLRLRAQLQYVRTSTAWIKWLRWYQDHDETLKLYTFQIMENGDHHFRSKLHEAVLRRERIAAYEERCTALVTDAQAEVKPFASAGRYTFFSDDTPYSVDISETMAAFAQTMISPTPMPRRATCEPIAIDFDALHRAAGTLDQKEDDLSFSRRGNWVSRLNAVKLMLFDADDTLRDSQAFTIDGVFHLVGKLGVGKSTLIWLITYALVTERNLHVTVVLNTVVETIRMAEWLIKMGVRAAPAVGRDRRGHAEKYASVTADTLNPEVVFDTTTDPAPAFEWLPTVCAISSIVPDGIHAGQEPCTRLRGEDDNPYRCPLIPVCPVHQVKRSLIDAQVWLVNPMSFLQSAAPDTLDGSPMRLLEAVYHRSDLVIVDEADRVQVQWDNAFAPLFSMAGAEESLLDSLHVHLSEMSVGRKGRRNAVDATFTRLTTIDSQAHTLTSHLFRVIQKHPQLATWIANSQLTNQGMFDSLVRDMLPTVSKKQDKDALKVHLIDLFAGYWRKGKPRTPEGKFLIDWIDDLLATTDGEKRLRTRLTLWLTKQLEWAAPLNDKQHLLIVKLDFCLTLTALLKRVQDILYLIPYLDTADNLQESRLSRLREAFVSLVPDPPIGTMLGVRHKGYEIGKDAGTLSVLNYRGLGRWLLTHFPTIYQDTKATVGAHLMLTSATSWFPGAASFDISPSPHAVLLPKAASNNRIDIKFQPVVIGTSAVYVSGAGDMRASNLQQMVRELARQRGSSPSVLQGELDHWGNRRVLLVVNSYQQVDLAYDALLEYPEWRGRVRKLLPDYRDEGDEGVLRAGQVEAFRDHDADILIAPLLSIQRGHNILDDEGNALLGSVFFLVRPYPPSEDLTPQPLGLNRWTLEQLEPNTRTLKAHFSPHGIKGLSKMRRTAYGVWNKRILSGNWGVNSLQADAYDELLRDQFVLIWQTIGRLLRGEQNARVFFVDGAFAPPDGHHTLRNWHELLQTLATATRPRDHALAQALYKIASDGFQRAHEREELGYTWHYEPT